MVSRETCFEHDIRTQGNEVGRHYCDLEALARSYSVRLTTKEGSGMLRLSPVIR
ncbi:UNVERIFIED_CONTAM: hypothetical protein Sradi_7032400 [Sesamum radiatum]|uniref:Uncharacterized protein n=1 Tax=Sesamum radiatum TaxID=300843 RepID=A0AAW2JA59_SESRA